MIPGGLSKSPLFQINFKRQLLTGANRNNLRISSKKIVVNTVRGPNQGVCTINKRFEDSHKHYNIDVGLTRMSSMAGTSSTISKNPNRLINEKSPYLLQHAYNPVDWYPWGDDAFRKAKSENKPIFLSIGYSTCHWCHVMERESFENEEVARLLNDNFVSIKVDREERPDVDKLYMTYVQRTTGSGGWPMSVFLTPDLEPFFGGTYFPPEDRRGHGGFKTILGLIEKHWEEQHEILKRDAKESMLKLQNLARNKFIKKGKVPDNTWMKCHQQLSSSFDSDYGGFSHAPKFPQPSIFNFLFHVYSKYKKTLEGQTSLEMCLTTLRFMAFGGIHDHVNGGFARYSVDDHWHLPHFEKMLYDQAQLTVAYVVAYVVSKDKFYADVVDDILTYVGRDLSHSEGGFYGAEDADSYPKHGDKEKKEGAFCVWEKSELSELLKDSTDGISHFELLCYHFNVEEKGNVPSQYDPHLELKNKNILSTTHTYKRAADHFKISEEKVKEILNECYKILYMERQKRPKPHVDTKIVTSWNGLMISGFAKAGFALKNEEYTNRAILAANFIRKYCYVGEKLYRCCYPGEDGKIINIETPILGFLDDYAFMIRGLLDLYEATLDSSWLQWAETLQASQDAYYWDSEEYGYFNSGVDDKTILVRDKEDQDGAEPCGNSVAVHNLLKLAAYLDRKDLKVKAEQILASFSERLSKVPVSLPEMSSALISYHSSPTQVFIAGKSEDKHTEALLDVVRSRYIPGSILAIADGAGGRSGLLYSRNQSLSKLTPVQGKSAAYVCRNFACSLPVTDPEELATSLDNESKRLKSRHSDSDSDSDSD